MRLIESTEPTQTEPIYTTRIETTYREIDDTPELDALAEMLASQKQGEVEIATKRLIEFGDKGMEVMIATLTKLEEKRKKRRYALGVGVIVWLLMMILIPIITKSTLPINPMITFITIFVSAGAVGASQKQTALTLATLEDVRVVGSLTSSLEWGDAAVRGEARKALQNLLPRLKESDSALLTLEQRKILLKQLTNDRESPEFLLSILKAFEQIGGEEAISTVTQVYRGLTPSGTFPDVKAAALEILPSLEARKIRQEQSQNLLRPSALSDPQPETLLRPVMGESSHTEDATQLLRPQE